MGIHADQASRLSRLRGRPELGWDETSSASPSSLADAAVDRRAPVVGATTVEMRFLPVFVTGT